MTHKRKQLPNGLNIFTLHVPDSQSVLFTILVKVGSRYETPKISGISHFLEHVFFKGSQNYPETSAISTLVDSIGGDFNAFTSKESTEYFIKAESKHFATIFDVLSDMVLNPLFKEEEIEKEKGVVVEEINLYQDNPGVQVETELEKEMWPDSQLGCEILGTKETVRTMTRKQIFEYKEKFYTADNIILGISGNFDEHILAKKIKETWAKLPKNNAPALKKLVDKQSKPSLKVEYKKTQQAHMAIGFKSYPHDHKNNIPTYLLASILGGNMSSRLFINIREEKGLAYYVSASNSTYFHTGNFTIHAGLQIEKAKDAMIEILSEVRKVKSDLITEKELRRAKDFVRGKIALALEDNHKKLDWVMERFAYTKKEKTLEEFYNILESTTPEDLQRIANDIFQNKKMNLAMIGPFKNVKELQKEFYLKENY